MHSVRKLDIYRRNSRFAKGLVKTPAMRTIHHKIVIAKDLQGWLTVRPNMINWGGKPVDLGDLLQRAAQQVNQQQRASRHIRVAVGRKCSTAGEELIRPGFIVYSWAEIIGDLRAVLRLFMIRVTVLVEKRA